MDSNRGYLYVGVGGHVVALDRATGAEMWRRHLHSRLFVTVRFDARGLFAGCRGEAFRLDPATGDILWRNELPGLGLGVLCFESSTEIVIAAAQEEEDAAAAAGG